MYYGELENRELTKVSIIVKKILWKIFLLITKNIYYAFIVL